MLLELLSLSHTADDLRARNTHIDRAAVLGAAVARSAQKRSTLSRFSRFSPAIVNPAIVNPAIVNPAEPVVDPAATSTGVAPTAAATAACMAA